MKCWECRKKISSYYKVPYSCWDKKLLEYKKKFRNICIECYPKLDFDRGILKVIKSSGRVLK